MDESHEKIFDVDTESMQTNEQQIAAQKIASMKR